MDVTQNHVGTSMTALESRDLLDVYGEIKKRILCRQKLRVNWVNISLYFTFQTIMLKKFAYLEVHLQHQFQINNK